MAIDIGHHIRDLRKQAGLTQEELAELSNTSVNFISQIERTNSQNISIQKLDNIANALGVTTPDLIKAAYSNNTTIKKDQGRYSLNRLEQKLKSLPIDKSERLCKYFLAIINEFTNEKN